MTPEQIRRFVEDCEERCRAAYEKGDKWFMDCVLTNSNHGRDQLYVWVSHWLAALLGQN